MAERLHDDGVFYGLVRTVEQIDQSTTVKFVFVSFIGEGVKPLRKARISTFKGTVTEAFEPFHAELLNATSKGEVTDEEITKLLASMFGTISDAKVGGEMRLPGGRTVKVTELFLFDGMERVAVEEASAGDIVTFAGLDTLQIGETLVDIANPMPLEPITVEQPQ